MQKSFLLCANEICTHYNLTEILICPTVHYFLKMDELTNIYFMEAMHKHTILVILGIE